MPGVDLPAFPRISLNDMVPSDWFSTSSILLACLVRHVPRTLCATVTIDNTDSSIDYSGTWSRTTIQGDPQEKNYMGTLSYSNITGSTATYVFTGTAVSVFGGFGPDGTYRMKSQYTIDGGSPTVLTPPSEVKVEQHRIQFFASPQLSPSKHTLVIENLGAQFFFDYLQFESPGESTSTTDPPTVTPKSTAASTAIDTTVTITTPQHVKAQSPITSGDDEVLTPTSTPLSTSAQLHNNGQAASTPEAESSKEQDPEASTGAVAQETSATRTSTVNEHLTTSTSGDPTNTSSARATVPSGDQTTVRAGVIGGLAVAIVVAILGAAAYGLLFHRRRQQRKSLSAEIGEVEGQGLEAKQEASVERGGHIMQGETIDEDMDPIQDHEETLDARERPRQDRVNGKGDRSTSHAELSNGRDGFGGSVVVSVAVMGARRRSTDGGLRLAGGPPGLESDPETASLSTLPPEYELHAC